MPSAPSPFAQLPPNAEGHFRLLFYTAVFHLDQYLKRLASRGDAAGLEQLPSFSFLAGYAAELQACLPPDAEVPDARVEEALIWWRAQVASWEASVKGHLPLRALARQLELSDAEMLTLLLTGLVEEDIRFGSLFAVLQDPLPARRPCLGLLGALAATAGPDNAFSDAWPLAQRLIEAGLVVVENQTAPRAEWILRVPPLLWDAVRGRASQRLGPECTLYPRREFPSLKKLAMDDGLREKLCRLPAVFAQGQISAVILRGMENSGRRTAMGSLARAMRRDLLFCDRRSLNSAGTDVWPLVGPFCALTGAFPVIAVNPGPGETMELPPLTGYRGPLGIVMRREGGVKGLAIERALTINLPAATAEQRAFVWRQSLGASVGGELNEITDRFLLPLGNVHRAAGMAAAYAALERRPAVTVSDVQQATRALNRQALDTLAARLDVSGDWDNLIVNSLTAADLRDLERRCRHREHLTQHLGAAFGSSVNYGVRALFNGPSGTGKTLAAKILAAAMSMDLYRLDLASVVNKYIGETEKNLSQVLARAEELDVLLLIDEGDALMTNRTDVKSANDRYANLETNYLLQRLETYQGVIVVTTNAGNRIDMAFQRRFDVVIEFSPPDPLERLLIWQQHLPARHCVSSAFLEETAQRCALTGGQIRNAALHAGLLAVDARRGEAVNEMDVEAGVQREYRKAGASYPFRRSEANHRHSVLTQFLAEIR